MLYEEIPIQNFIYQKYQTQQVQKIVETWRVEPHLVIDKLVEHFREMGIFSVTFRHERLIMKSMLIHLRNSPELMRMVVKVRNEEARRQRNRHAD